MKINLKVIPGAKKSEVSVKDDLIKVRVQSKAVEGKANDALIDILAQYYGVKKCQISIIKGLKSRNKTINIEHI